MKVNEIPALSIDACRVSQMRRLSESINWDVRGAKCEVGSKKLYKEYKQISHFSHPISHFQYFDITHGTCYVYSHPERSAAESKDLSYEFNVTRVQSIKLRKRIF